MIVGRPNLDDATRTSLARAMKRYIDLGWSADNAANEIVNNFNGQGVGATEMAVERRINMAYLFDVFEAIDGRTPYEYADTV